MSVKMKNRAGLSLIELLVALVLLGVMITSVAGLTFEAGRRSIVTAADNYRQAEMIRELNRVTAMPYSSLTNGTTCRTVTAMPFPHTACVTAATLGNYSKTVRIIISPTVRGVAPDTLVFVRASAPAVNPLNI